MRLIDADALKESIVTATLEEDVKNITRCLHYPCRKIIEAIDNAPTIEERTEERMETHACDLIDRQAAIDVLDVLCQEHRYKIPGKIETYSQYNEAWQDALDRAEGAIFNLPSAQTEIILCKDCVHWVRTCGDNQWGLGDCDVFDKHLVMCEGFCAWAERREE